MTDLDAAYSLDGPEDCRRLYAAWAATYDSGFAADMDYRLPAHVAAAFLSHGGTGPVLDVGAGTGLLAEAFRTLSFQGKIDAVDLSQEMLDRAREKRIYTNLFAADVTSPLSLPRRYAGIVSSGTFTHGHVGPEAVERLETVASPGALFAISINAAVFDARGFDRALARRPDVTMLEVPIYGPASSDSAHRADSALIALWRHAG